MELLNLMVVYPTHCSKYLVGVSDTCTKVPSNKDMCLASVCQQNAIIHQAAGC
jgi:hypothetical protein